MIFLQDTAGIPRLMFVGTLAMLILAIGIIVFVIFHQRKVIRYQMQMKRLEAEKFAWPRDGEAAAHELTAQQFEWLLEGFDLWRHAPHKSLHFTSVS